MIDTHCHLYDKKLINDLDDIVINAKNANIIKMICIGDSIETSKKSIEISETYNQIYASFGIHPHEAREAPNLYLDIIKKNAVHKKVVAIGEIGLDYHYNFSDPKIQKKVFREQLELAKELDLPAVVHCRNADEDLYNIISESKHSKGVVHCFASDISFANKIIDLGFKISFTGMITFVKHLEIVIKAIDLKHLLIETDSPYLTPIPYRGKTNQPAYVKQIAKAIASIKNISIEEVDRITTENAFLLFNKLSN
tara:strand:+ start:822 stop:1580 length:759 start_codon:yes stop_codon:yes gene_type:complete